LVLRYVKAIAVHWCFSKGSTVGGDTAKARRFRPMADGKHILLVLEADSAVRDSLKFSLEVEGFEVRAYASPDELLNDNDLPEFGCLIAHYHLPTMNGLDVITKLRERRNSMPALLMTGRPNAIIRERASAAGIAVFEKPVRGTELIDYIHKILD
jgi:two-component system, LuxR family, response regulator FixJ